MEALQWGYQSIGYIDPMTPLHVPVKVDGAYF